MSDKKEFAVPADFNPQERTVPADEADSTEVVGQIIDLMEALKKALDKESASEVDCSAVIPPGSED